MENVVYYEIEEKKGRKYEVTNRVEDETEVYKRLSNDMISKKICNCTYIRSITRSQLYYGFVNIYVSYTNGIRCTYHIKSND